MPPSFSLLPVSDLTVLEAEHKRIVEMQAGLQAKYDDYKSMLTVFDRRVSEGDGSAASWASNCSEMVEQCKKDMRELEARRIKVLVEVRFSRVGSWDIVRTRVVDERRSIMRSRKGMVAGGRRRWLRRDPRKLYKRKIYPSENTKWGNHK